MSQDVEHIIISNISIEPMILDLIPIRLVEKYEVVPIRKEDRTLVVATNTPENLELKDRLQQETNLLIKFVYAESEDIRRAIINLFGKLDDIFARITLPKSTNQIKKKTFIREIDITMLLSLKEVPTIPQLLDIILYYGVTFNVSDIHIEPTRDQLQIRIRLDGVLHTFRVFPSSFHKPLVTVIKIQSNMDITESRLPQDGHFEIRLKDKVVGVRVASVNTIYGEKITIRLLDREVLRVSLTELGFSKTTLYELNKLINLSTGMILVTGPTGSGKTTSLYALLEELKDSSKNILSVEEPVEYRLDHVNQVETNPGINLDFEKICRAFLRQDPDVVLIGEIRDEKTVKVAVQNALVGALLFATLHSNDAIRTLDRLENLGLPPYLIASTLSAVLAQRLIRRNCPYCQVKYKPSPILLERLKLSQDAEYVKGSGCSNCLFTGFKGRICISELLILDSVKIQKAIEQKLPYTEFKDIAIKSGFTTIQEDAALKIKEGISTVEEVSRVITL
ncbi:type II secretion system protein GspE [Candidatus Marinamargulisbacteria bacterium SCGC AG-410-N11]|nr:type II secretion system protein GspE [Candidatus Marinamargulisbacteria bacterium SCGC AG-410-N11]